MFGDRKPVSVSGALELLLDDGQTARITVGPLDLRDVGAYGSHSRLSTGVEYPEYRVDPDPLGIALRGYQGRGYLTVDAMLRATEEANGIFFTINVPKEREETASE